MNSNPAAAQNNLHHMGGYKSEQDLLDEVLGKGPGDPDNIIGEEERIEYDPERTDERPF